MFYSTQGMFPGILLISALLFISLNASAHGKHHHDGGRGIVKYVIVKPVHHYHVGKKTEHHHGTINKDYERTYHKHRSITWKKRQSRHRHLLQDRHQNSVGISIFKTF
ncbi:MAG: hypothetical protein HKP55_11175 [Gammaproteobacteria bacterium]|nr:hypothetical protein [Gammaproteobacteria bacterium]NNJ92228.1 hypothetical protein [Gammaproteobacteria bacterium]